MTLTLTSDQLSALHAANAGDAVAVYDPVQHRAYFLVPADVYQRLATADGEQLPYEPMDEVARREGWDDPEMDAYDKLDPRLHA